MTATAERRSYSVRAGAVIKRALERRNHRDRYDLEAELERRGIPAYYVARGVRVIRDAYGDSFLICEPGTYEYVLDPTLAGGTEYLHQRARDALTRARHQDDGFAWLAAVYGNRGGVRRARRHVRNLVEELEELVDSVGANGV